MNLAVRLAHLLMLKKNMDIYEVPIKVAYF